MRAITATSSVPTTSGMTPNRNGRIDADHTVPVRKSIGLTGRKNSIAWRSRTRTIPIVVRTPSAARQEQERLDRPAREAGCGRSSGRAGGGHRQVHLRDEVTAPADPPRSAGGVELARASGYFRAAARASFDLARTSGVASM